MQTISISEIAKKPSILDNIDDVTQIVNKKTNELKGVFISAKDMPYIQKILEELEYKKWQQRNRGLFESSGESIELFEDVIEELGDRITYD